MRRSMCWTPKYLGASPRTWEEAKDFADCKNRRTFKFSHLFAGPRDVLGEALKAECDKEGLQVEVISFDKMISADHDLAAEQPFGKMLDQAKQHEFDGGHAGFPCGSFSRARYNPKGDGPPPVRSGTEIYGLSTNNKMQHTEADRGTVLAVRSAMIVGQEDLCQLLERWRTLQSLTRRRDQLGSFRS